MQTGPPDGAAPEPWAPIPAVARGSNRSLLKLLVIFAVVFGGCSTFLVANTRARETIIAFSKGATKAYYLPSDATATTCSGLNSPTCGDVKIPADSYYVMGDNRPESKDSRAFGPIPRSSVKAVVIRITAPPSRAGSVPGSSR